MFSFLNDVRRWNEKAGDRLKYAVSPIQFTYHLISFEVPPCHLIAASICPSMRSLQYRGYVSVCNSRMIQGKKGTVKMRGAGKSRPVKSGEEVRGDPRLEYEARFHTKLL
jgi:hypothetical protein